MAGAGAAVEGVELDADGTVAAAAGGAPKEQLVTGMLLEDSVGFSACFSAGFGNIRVAAAGAATAAGAGAGAGAAGWMVTSGAGVGVADLAASLAASLRSLSLVIAAASRSCFSHFEYVLGAAAFEGLGSGEVTTGGVAGVREVTRRLGAN